MRSVWSTRKISKPMKGVWEPPIYRKLVGSTGHNLRLATGIWSGGAFLWEWAINLWSLCQVWAISGRIQLNYKISGGICRELENWLVWGDHRHVWCQKCCEYDSTGKRGALLSPRVSFLMLTMDHGLWFLTLHNFTQIPYGELSKSQLLLGSWHL